MAIKISELPRITNGNVNANVIFPGVLSGTTYSVSFANIASYVSNAVTSFTSITTANVVSTNATITTASVTTLSATTLSVSGTINGGALTTYLASPPAIGGTTANTGKFTTLAVTSPVVPTANNSAGTAGTVAWDSGFIYVCVATNTWRRASISSW